MKKNLNVWVTVAMLLLVTVSIATGKIVYVDADAAGVNDGSSWQDAYKCLQDALAVAEYGDEIWVAEGVHKPDEHFVTGRGGPQVSGSGNRNATFRLINGVTLKGSYAGFGQPDPNARDIQLYETTLSGDLSDNDAVVADPQYLPTEPTRAENSIHVVTGSRTDETAVIDGFTITAGNAHSIVEVQQIDEKVRGGGMYNDSGSPTVSNCTLQANSADWFAGGMSNWQSSSPKLINCNFINNGARYIEIEGLASLGGGMLNVFESNPILNNCVFIGNKAMQGGGIINYESSPTLNHCEFIGNSAIYAGAMLNSSSHPKLSYCVFRENSASYHGGALFNADSSNPTIVNCTFIQNLAEQGMGGGMSNNDNSKPTLILCTFTENEATDGGGMSNASGYPTLTNCIFSNNTATTNGGGMSNHQSNLILTNCIFTGNTATTNGGAVFNEQNSNLTLSNCIVRGNSPQHIYDTDGSSSSVTYSNVQGGQPGVGNIDIDPGFVDAENGDYHLKSQAGRWDAVSQSWVQDDMTSPCIDAGDPAGLIGWEPFPNGAVVNMGAYGGTTEASKSWFDGPVCDTPIAGDLNGDCAVNLVDLAILTSHWLQEVLPVTVVKKGPYLIYPGDNTQMTVLWQLDTTRDCTLEWGTDTNYGNSVTSSEYGSDHQHQYTITSLTPGAKYYYQVDVYGSYLTGSFLAAPAADAQNVKFLAYGDTRTNPDIHDAVNAQMIATYTADPEYQTFTLLTGDWVSSNSESNWASQFFGRGWSNTLQMQANLPIQGCMGNHEGAGTVFEKYWPYPYQSGGRYWSFDYGPAHIVVLDQYTNYAPGSPQYTWLQNDLANATAPWKFIQLHEPGWTAGRHENDEVVQEYIQPLCETYGVAIVFAGHNHYYARALEEGVAHITTGGGGAPLYPPEDEHPNIVAYDESHHFCKIDIQGKQLTFEAVRLDGTIIDTFTISH